MKARKKLFAIIGSASRNSANHRLVEMVASLVKDDFDFKIFNDLKMLPHFDPELSVDNPPASIITLRNEIENADGILICTPEYVFSIPSGLKNVIEWCVSTTIFTDKPCGLITASAHGEKGHQELQLIMKTVMARFTNETTLLIQGVKGKIDKQGQIADEKTREDLAAFVNSFKALVRE